MKSQAFVNIATWVALACLIVGTFFGLKVLSWIAIAVYAGTLVVAVQRARRRGRLRRVLVVAPMFLLLLLGGTALVVFFVPRWWSWLVAGAWLIAVFVGLVILRDRMDARDALRLGAAGGAEDTTATALSIPAAEIDETPGGALK